MAAPQVHSIVAKKKVTLESYEVLQMENGRYMIRGKAKGIDSDVWSPISEANAKKWAAGKPIKKYVVPAAKKAERAAAKKRKSERKAKAKEKAKAQAAKEKAKAKAASA